MEIRGDFSGGRIIFRQDNVGSVDADPEDLEDRKEAEMEHQGAQSLSNSCRKRLIPFVASDRRFSNILSTIDPLLGGSMRVT